MKSEKTAIKVTQFVLYILCLVFAIFIFASPVLFKMFCEAAGYNHSKYVALLITFYICSPSAVVTILYLNKLLNCTKDGEIFSQKAIKCLKVLFWSCISAMPLSLPLCFFFYGAFPLPVSAFFIALILQVVKCVIAEGTHLKAENDLTI